MRGNGLADGHPDPRMECARDDCGREAAVRLHVPWADDEEVCAAHARAAARQDGVVAVPLTDAEEWQ